MSVRAKFKVEERTEAMKMYEKYRNEKDNYHKYI